MSSLTSRHDPVAQAPQPAAPRRAKPASLFARLFLVPRMSGWEKALVWLMVLIVMVIAWTVFGTYEALADDSTPPPTVRVSALPVGTLTPIPTETPELLPATTITLEVDADTLAPSTVKPARLAATGGPDLPSVAGFALVVVVVTGLGMRWVLR